MSIAIFKLYANKIGGTEKAVFNLSKMLEDYNYNYNYNYNYSIYSAIDKKEINNCNSEEKILFNNDYLKHNSRIKFYLMYFKKVILAGRRHDLIISTDIATSTLILLGRLLKLIPSNIICWEHYPFEKNSKFWQKIFMLLFKVKNDAIIVCNSEKEKEKFYFADNVMVIPNAIAIGSQEHQYTIKNNKLDLLYIGRVVKDKGVERLIDAVISFPGKNNHILHIVGGGDELEFLKNKYNSCKEIIFHGPRLNIDHYLSSSDVFVSGSYFECFPVTVLEAMSHGLPIVSLDTSGGTNSVISGSGAGFICNNVNEFHEKIVFFEKYENRVLYGRAGRIFSSENYSKEVINNIWNNLINSILSDK